jgi:hypothetical protein
VNPQDVPADDPVEHLWNAASEVLAAVRKFVDAADEFVQEQRVRPRPPDADSSRLHHIDIDIDDADGREGSPG